MPFIIQQGIQVYTQANVWGADAPMVFLNAAETEPIAESARARGNRKTQVVAFDDEYEACQLSGYRAAANAVRDYGCRIEPDGALHCTSINGGPELRFEYRDSSHRDTPNTVSREDVRTMEHRLLSDVELEYQFAEDTPIARWLRLLYGVKEASDV